jgi:hypothetical protein
MAWQRRGNHLYRGRVTTHYLGRESRAHQAALENQARHTARTQARQEQQAWEALDARVDILNR